VTLSRRALAAAPARTGQNANYLDSLFVGEFLGHQSDLADGSLHQYDFRHYNNIVGDYYLSPRFLDKIAVGPPPGRLSCCCCCCCW
jgi:hypothetical protein